MKLIEMKKILLLLLLINSCLLNWTKAQIITFDDQGHTSGQNLSNPYTIVNNGETFSFTVSGGSATNHVYRTSEPSCGSTGISHLHAGTTSQTTWTIETTSGNEIDLGTIRFDNVFSCFSFSYSLTIEGFQNNTSTGTQAFTVNGLNAIFTPNSDFDQIDKLVITSGDISHLGIDDISWSLNVLPVELLSFFGEEKNNSIHLKWMTATETNNDRFDIETSKNGQEYVKIGEVQGKGTAAEQQEYSFKIDNPQNGISYYRLKQIDFDGQFEYSKVVVVDVLIQKEIVVKPNPTSGVLFVEGLEEGEVSVLNASGCVLKEGILLDQKIDISTLPTGLYFIHILSEHTVYSERVFKSNHN